MNTDHSELAESIAYCGLICRLCFLADKCDGCKTDKNLCERNCSDEGCFNRSCCESKGLKGCYECAEISACIQGIFSLGDMSKIKAFSICIREDGIESFVSYVISNIKKGLSVEKGKDYDGKCIDEVLKVLRNVDES
ncbi:MAG TPA: DUF3795 domain-containing protein [Spirochaetota bacterium]|nr:DUF3795 domain-containing protein [Spirochaetota bacterium]HOR45477.1 DUF3795 domain-containing protein [Spirochaetota bacterium]HPK57080.1 DUF3795 domain-containing protein [Spirochaetota bacterium]